MSIPPYPDGSGGYPGLPWPPDPSAPPPSPDDPYEPLDLPPAPPMQGDLVPPPDSYDRSTRQRVFYLPVTAGEDLLGYLWAAAANPNACGFIRNMRFADRSLKASSFWNRRLDEAYRERLPAQDAVRRWRGAPEDPEGGTIPADAQEQWAPSRIALAEALNPGGPHSPGPLVQDGLYPDGTPVDRSQGWGPLVSVSPPTYPQETAEPVIYLPVVLGGNLVGYVWAAVPGDAAGYLWRGPAGRAGTIAAGLWQARLSDAFHAGAHAVEAIRTFRGLAEDHLSGTVPADAAEQQAASLDDLKRLAEQ
ncbi:hypothetical protein [Actinomadura opuntiae]|uniref:hypothetical protein n=1 Tax=Actinomadura sp. OS1-43 TaxID=604315 RepID=UPI00255AE7AB|nr:hypothetical protein [Actinomadura sp. OS1-43]MDL4814887.1 hypothetical protein [Actinomadura sp. OS1-43]